MTDHCASDESPCPKLSELESERPYENINISTLPDWWQRAIIHFEERGIDPYRPPLFADGSLAPRVLRDLEDELAVTIEFRCKNATVGEDWTVTLDGEAIGMIGRHRNRGGYSVYKMSTAEFRDWIRSESMSSKP